MKNLPIETSETIPSYLPLAMGAAALAVCLNEFPLALAGINLIGNIASKSTSLRNEKQIKILLESLDKRLDNLNAQNILIKNKLREHEPYQEVAHKRLLSISALDSKEDLDLSAGLIALCGSLTGNDLKDKYLLSALGEISINELKLLFLGINKRSQFEKQKSESEFAHKDVAEENEILSKVSIEFFNEGRLLLGLDDFNHFIGRLHSFGIITAQSTSGYSTYDRTKKISPLKLTTLGEYFILQLNRTGIRL